ncbi:hypothetical protein MPER_09020 [Moniliophthora perniciosa FA553]|nr:hypothetical protein MPER_09020 [Moniliophthora perniciosa FA553]
MALASNDSGHNLYVNGNRMTLSALVINVAISFSVTLLTAGRIWFISHQIRRLYGQKTSPKYRTVIAIILESGLLCPLAITINLIITNVTDPESAPIDFSAVVYQIAGIAPTLVIARAQTGKSIESVDRHISTIQFAARQDVENPREFMSRSPQQVSISIGRLPRAQDEPEDASSNSENWSRNLSRKE